MRSPQHTKKPPSGDRLPANARIPRPLGEKGGGGSTACLRVTGLVLIAGPFLYYAWFAWRHLVPIEYPDAVTYLWRHPFNLHYLTNRSLTQRLLFSLLGNHLGLIAALHLLLYLATGGALFCLFARRGRTAFNLALATCLAFVLSSYTFNVSAVAIAAEPVFMCLLLLFPCVLFLERGRLGPIAVLISGLAFVFSRNLAPPTLLVFLLVRLVALRPAPDRRRGWVYAGLVGTALASIAVTAHTDTSLAINTVNNIYQRVLTDPVSTAHFQAKYGMPDGPFLEMCRGRNVLDRCLGQRILFVNPDSQNYDLRDDKQGFVRWVKQEGRRAYVSYLLWDDPGRAHAMLQRDYALLVRSDAIRFVIQYLGRKLSSNVPNNRVSIESSGRGRDVGLLGFDSLALLRDALLPIGLARLHSVLLFAALGLTLCRLLPFTSHLALGTGMLCGGLASFFLGYFGDAVEIPRHVFPSLVLLVAGGVIYFFSLAEILSTEFQLGWARWRLQAGGG
jgi:hypothetical protein